MKANPFAIRSPAPEKVVPMVEALQALQDLTPPAWEADIGRAIGHASARNWDLLWDRLQAAAWANVGTPFGDAVEPLRARAEKLSMASAPSVPRVHTARRLGW
jgi:hypothetical protein